MLTVSIHGHPRHSYPNFAGYVDERGEGDGVGSNRNFLLEPPVDDTAHLATLKRAIQKIESLKTRVLVVSLGYDIMRGDPTGSFSVSPQGMREIGHTLGALGHPLLVIQEGESSLRNLRLGAHAFFLGIASAWYGR